MNLLVFYPHVPYPLDRSHCHRTYHFLQALAKEYTVDLLALSENGEHLCYRSTFESFCRNVRIIEFVHPVGKKFPRRFFDLMPETVRHWTKQRVGEALQDMISTGGYDAVHVFDISLAQYFVKKFPKLPVILDRSRVDLQVLLHQNRSATTSWSKRLGSLEGLAKMWLHEKRVAARVTAQIVAGPDDQLFIRDQIHPRLPVKVIADGVDLACFHPRSVSERRAEEPTVLFCGAMDEPSNIDALGWYFGKIHERLRAVVSELKVLIVGKSPVPEIQAYATKPGVTVTGHVHDIRVYYRRAWLHIVPLRIGGGLRTKIMESLAMGTAVVSTTVGVLGLDLVEDYDFLLADDAETFARQAAGVLCDHGLRQALERAGVETSLDRLPWSAASAQLHEFYAQVIPNWKKNAPKAVVKATPAFVFPPGCPLPPGSFPVAKTA